MRQAGHKPGHRTKPRFLKALVGAFGGLVIGINISLMRLKKKAVTYPRGIVKGAEATFDRDACDAQAMEDKPCHAKDGAASMEYAYLLNPGDMRAALGAGRYSELPRAHDTQRRSGRGGGIPDTQAGQQFGKAQEGGGQLHHSEAQAEVNRGTRSENYAVAQRQLSPGTTYP